MTISKPLFDEKLLASLPPHEREKAINAILTVQNYEDINPLFYYNHPILSEKPPHWKQLAFHAFPQRKRIFLGGNQSGKTTAGLVDDIIQAVDWDIVPEHLHFIKRYDPPCYIRILSTDLNTLQLSLLSKLREFLPVDQLLNARWDKAYNQQLRILRFANGSMMQFMTYKQDVQDMGGATLHRVHYDEEPPEIVWEENRVRTMRLGGDHIITMTPLQGLTWTYSNIVEEHLRPENEILTGSLWESDEWGIALVDMDDNPYLTEEDKFDLLKDYSPEVIKARKSGQHVHFAGLIYGEFDKSIHVKPDHFGNVIQRDPDSGEKIINPHMNVVVAIDPGIRNRCAVIWAALDYEDNMYVFDELYEQGATIGEICKLIHLTNAKWKANPLYYVIDPAGRNTNLQTGRSDQMEFSDHGIVTIAGQHDVEPGINRVKERLRNERLFIFDNNINLIREFTKYRWKESPRTGDDGKPVPVKTEDHAMDAFRYLVMSRPYRPSEQKYENETSLQRLMREDIERTSKPQAYSSFGGGMFR